ncbi:MAG: Bax inhibitor-1/YccA family protein [Alphaproteobacteria bacterium]|nr:Bax inhibitor-1/YccA family protein [Alphaproteobacteria bacterium]
MIENKYTSAVEKADVDEGLRSYFISVYNYMGIGLLITALAAFLVANSSLINMMFDARGSMSGLGWLFLLAPLIVVFGFGWVVARGTLNQVRGVFLLYSALMGVSLAPIFLVYTGTSMARVFLITAGTFGAMSMYGYVTKRDLTAMGSFLMMGLWGVIIAMLVNIFMQSSAVTYAVSIISVFVFVGLTAYDTQKIRMIYMESDNEDTQGRKVIVGALELYLDFINLFMSLLRLMGDRR